MTEFLTKMPGWRKRLIHSGGKSRDLINAQAFIHVPCDPYTEQSNWVDGIYFDHSGAGKGNFSGRLRGEQHLKRKAKALKWREASSEAQAEKA